MRLSHERYRGEPVAVSTTGCSSAARHFTLQPYTSMNINITADSKRLESVSACSERDFNDFGDLNFDDSNEFKVCLIVRF